MGPIFALSSNSCKLVFTYLHGKTVHEAATMASVSWAVLHQPRARARLSHYSLRRVADARLHSTSNAACDDSLARVTLLTTSVHCIKRLW